MNDVIKIRGARTHNLKNVDLDIPINKITCFCGASGAGKTSLAFHTLATESRRRFINSFATNVKFFWDIPHTVDVDHLSPVLPVWSLPQNNPVVGARPTVADLMGCHEDFEKIFFHAGRALCPAHLIPFEVLDQKEQVRKWLERESNGEGDVIHLFLRREAYQQSYGNSMLPSRSLQESLQGHSLNSFQYEDDYWEVLRFKYSKSKDINKALGKLEDLKYDELLIFNKTQNITQKVEISNKALCPVCATEEEVAVVGPYHLSPYNAHGACSECQGHGMNLIYDRDKLLKHPEKSLSEGAVSFLNYKRFSYVFPDMLDEAQRIGIDINQPFNKIKSEKVWNFLMKGRGEFPGIDRLLKILESKKYKQGVRILIRSLQKEEICKKCNGSRLSEFAHQRSLNFKDEVLYFGDLLALNIEEAFGELEAWDRDCDFIAPAKHALQRAMEKLKTAIDLGIGHLDLSRRVKTLSPSEYQRLLLNKYLSYQGSGSLFVLDEPALGLEKSIQAKLLEKLRNLRDQGNTVIIIEHSHYLQKHSDYLIEIGPMAGEKGGSITFNGPPSERPDDINKNLMQGFRPININLTTHKVQVEARGKNYLFDMPDSGVVWVHGDSGSGKTSAIVQGLGNSLSQRNTQQSLTSTIWPTESLLLNKKYKKVILFSLEAIHFSSRSSVGTYLGISPYVRKHFTSLPSSKSMNLKDGHFSANSELGMCQTCQGKGVKTVELSFVEDVSFTCDECEGMKLRPLFANISDGKVTFHEMVNMPMRQVFEHIKMTPKLIHLRELMKVLKIDYLNIDRPLSSLSGGEKQRIRLLSELQLGVSESALFFENLSFGLSEREIVGPMELILELAKKSNLVVILDQNSAFAKIANYSLHFQLTDGSTTIKAR